jgi:hypothetical protein
MQGGQQAGQRACVFSLATGRVDSPSAQPQRAAPARSPSPSPSSSTGRPRRLAFMGCGVSRARMWVTMGPPRPHTTIVSPSRSMPAAGEVGDRRGGGGGGPRGGGGGGLLWLWARLVMAKWLLLL